MNYNHKHQVKSIKIHICFQQKIDLYVRVLYELQHNLNVGTTSYKM